MHNCIIVLKDCIALMCLCRNICFVLRIISNNTIKNSIVNLHLLRHGVIVEHCFVLGNNLCKENLLAFA
jgi:hypothetical protein